MGKTIYPKMDGTSVSTHTELTYYLFTLLKYPHHMLKKINPTETRSWGILQELHEQNRDTSLKDLFANNPDRFGHFSIQHKDILLDYSKNHIDHKVLAALLLWPKN